MKTNLWRRLLFFILLYLSFSSSPGFWRSAFAQLSYHSSFSEVNYTVHFSENDLILSKRDGFDLVELKDGARIGEIGKPGLPLKLVHLLIPNDSEVESLIVMSSSYRLIEGEYLIFPTQPDEKTDGMSQKVWVPPDSITYASDSSYLGKLGEIVESGYLAGNQIITIAVYPIQYRPNSKKLLFYTDLNLKLKLKSTTKVPSSSIIEGGSYQTSEILAGILYEMVDNKTALSNCVLPGSDYRLSNANGEGSDRYPYLIITSSGLKSAFLPLLEWKIKKGIKSAIVSVDSILNAYSGRDDAEKIRNFLIDAHRNGTTWVLLGGDENVVPVRYAYHTNTSTFPEIAQQQICDLYYSDVDGEWDSDNDGIWGEPGDDSPDIYPDLFVGRVPCGNSGEAASFVEKLLLYEKNPGNGSTHYLTSALWMCSDQMRDWSGGTGQHILASEYMASNFFQDLSTLIENPSGSAENPISPEGENCIDKMNQGWGISVVLAHGTPNGFVAKSNQTNGVPRSWVYTAPGGNDGHGHLPSLSNQGKYGIMYSIACKQSALDMGSDPCVGKLYPLSQNNGGVAFLGYTRWGWVGTSYQLLEKFLQYLFTSSSQHHLGIAEALSRCSYPSYRDLNYGHNLFGDPEMQVWTEIPHSLTATHPAKVTLGLQTINVSVTSQRVGLAGATVCLSLNQRILFLGVTDQNGLLSAQVNLDDLGEMSVVVTKMNFLPYEGNITISLAADVDEDDTEENTKSFGLSQNYPNPFNPVTSIQYSVGRKQTKTADGGLALSEVEGRRTADGSFNHVTLKIYNVLGQLVRTLVDEPKRPERYEVIWDGKDEKGKEVSSGIYFYTLSAENYQEIKKMILVK
jgi:hypothetical protein